MSSRERMAGSRTRHWNVELRCRLKQNGDDANGVACVIAILFVHAGGSRTIMPPAAGLARDSLLAEARDSPERAPPAAASDSPAVPAEASGSQAVSARAAS